MKKNAFYLLLLLSVLVLSCRSEEAISEKTEFAEQITSFKKFEEKIASDLSYRARQLQNFEKKAKTNSHKSMQKTSSTIDIPISDVSYKIPFRETIENYFANHSDYAQSFYATFGQPFYAVSTYTYGYNGNAVKAIAFPIVKEGLVTGIIHGVVSANRDFVYFTVVQNTDSTTQKVITDLQYEIDNLYPKGPEIMSRLIVEREARQREIEGVSLYYLQDRSGGGGGVWNIFLPNNYWYRDTNIIFEGNGGAGAGGAMSGGASKHNTKFPDYLDPNDPCANAKNPSATATTNSKTTTFTNAKTSISGMNNNKENGVVFGNVNGTTQSTGMQTGGEHSIILTHSFSNPTGDLHNHTDNTPPSPGDVYSLINARNNFANYSTRYVTTPDGTIYALVVTDTDAMNAFLQNYPPNQVNPNMSPNFSGQMFKDWFDFTFDGYGSDEMALSYVLDKYNTGIALTKLENNEFRKINVQQENTNGETTYKQTPCP